MSRSALTQLRAPAYLLALNLLIATSPAMAQENSANGAENSAYSQASSVCEFYINKNTELNCSYKNYLISYGYTYCLRFEETTKHYSTAGQNTLAQIRQCLIDELNVSYLTCENARAIGYSSHVPCYIKNGFCQLQTADRMHILLTVYRELFSRVFVQIAAQIQSACE